MTECFYLPSFLRVFFRIGSTHRLEKKSSTTSMHNTSIQRVDCFDTISNTISAPINIISEINAMISSVDLFMLQGN